jgi:hypothetical protein
MWKRLALLAPLIASSLAVVSQVSTPASAQTTPTVLVDEAACSANELPRNDDGSTGAVALGFTADFYGEEFSTVYVNNNGNVTFDSPLPTYTPFPLSSVTRQIIAPFFGDVDTRSTGSDILRYGYGTAVFEGRPAFCATWKNVGYYSFGIDKLNSFQLLLVDRSDRGTGDFDIVFNYDKIQWESGSASGGSGGIGGSPARAGFSNGSGQPGTSYELPGSGVSGAFLDSSPTGLVTRSVGSASPGRLIFTVTGGQPNVGGNQDPDFADWHTGDVHAHATGDTHLGIHPQCKDEPNLTLLTCAFRLIDNTLDRAARFDTEWLIFTEHMPWLGFQKDGDIIYKFGQAEEQWETIRSMVDAASNPQIRGLLGAELGTAVPACTRFSAEVTWSRPPLSPFPTPSWGGINYDSPGHFGVYYTPTAIDDSIYDCDETGENGYVDDVEEAGGFGGINHPDNDDGGSPWWCYSSERNGDGNLQGAQHQPQVGRFERCNIGIDQYAAETPGDAGAFRSIELISGNNMPSNQALSTYDMFLQNGYRIAAVGGGDGHTAPRKQSAADGVKCVLNPLNGLGECVDKGSTPGDPNHNKTGGSGRTLAFYETDPSTGSGYSSTDADDPVRVAIRNGETVATNGPKATAQIGGMHPGQEVSVAGTGPTELRIDWTDEWKWSGDILAGGDERNFTRVPADEFLDLPTGADPMLNTSAQLSTTTPSKIVVVTAERDGCGWDRNTCRNQTNRQTFEISADGTVANGDLDVNASANVATLMVDPPADGYVRVELYWEDGLSEKFTPDFVAVTSPIFVTQSSAPAVITGTVRDQTSAPVPGALVELCRIAPAQRCVTRLTGSNGTFSPVVSSGGTWAQRTFPPAGRNDLGVSQSELGTIAPDAARTVNITLPAAPSISPYIDPSGVVVDTFGQPIENATVTLLYSDDIGGPFEAVEDGGVIMSPANRSNPDLTNDLGEFRWDVLAGWFKVSATKPGCLSEFGDDAAVTPALQVPPPALDLELVLDCRAPDDVAPVIDIDGPEFTNAIDVVFDVVLSGESDYAFAACIIDGGPLVDSDGDVDGEFPECGDQFTAAGLDEGVHVLGVIAFDDHQNMSFAEVEFTIDRTAPTIEITGVEPDATYSTRNIPTPACAADDELSGVDGICSGVLTPADGITGVWTYAATAIDRAGNTTDVVVSFVVEQDPVALWSSSPDHPLTVRGRADIGGLVHSEQNIDMRGNVTVNGGAEYVGVADVRGNVSIAPDPIRVNAGVVPQQLRDLAQWADTGVAATAAPAGACSTGTWRPLPADLNGAAVITVDCDVEIGGWKKSNVIESTLVVAGSISVLSGNIFFDSGDRPSLVATGPGASIDIRGNDVRATGLVSDGPISISGNRARLLDPARPSLVTTSPGGTIDLHTSNSTFVGGVLSSSGFDLNGGNNEFACGIYAATITLGGGNSSMASCPQR